MRKFNEADGSAVYLKAIVALLALQIVVGIIAVGASAGGRDITQNAYFNYAAMTVFQIANVSVVAVHYARKKTRPTVSVRNRIQWPTLVLGAAVGAVCIFCFYGLAAAFQTMLDKVGYQGQADIPLSGAGQIAMGLIVTVLFAPIGEELVYRGALLSGLRKGYPWWAAVLLSGLAFACMHMSPQQTVYQFCLGCACAFLALAARSPLPAMLAHGVSNLLAVLLSVTQFGVSFDAFVGRIAAHTGAAVCTVLFSALLGIGIVFGIGVLIRKFFATRPAAETAEQTEPARAADGAILSADTTADSAAAAADKPVDPNDPLATGNLLGKHTGKILYGLALGITLFVWIYSLVQGL